MRILFTGGGTGGHIYPLIAIAREIKKIAEEEKIIDLQLYYLGPNSLGGEDLKKEGVVSYYLFAGKIRRYPSLRNFGDIFKTFFGVIGAAWKLFIILPDVIFSKGGYGAFPVLLVARFYRIPVIIHESDAIPGLVNSWSSKFAKRIAVAFEKTADFFPPQKTAVVGNPIRKRLLGANLDEAKANLSMVSNLSVVFFIGGSQGSVNLNNVVVAILPELIKKYEVIHQTGADNYEGVRQETAIMLERLSKGRYHPFPFLTENKLREAYAASNLIVSRASSSIFEIAALQKPSILIPLPNSAQDHQRENAYEYAKAGATVVIEEANLTPHLLLNDIDRILTSRDVQNKMKESAQGFARIDSAETIAREIIKLGLH